MTIKTYQIWLINKLHKFLNWNVCKRDLKTKHIKKSGHTSGKNAYDSLLSNMFQKCRSAEIVKLNCQMKTVLHKSNWTILGQFSTLVMLSGFLQPIFPPYRKQSTDLHSESNGWFLYGEIIPEYQYSTPENIEMKTRIDVKWIDQLKTCSTRLMH